MHDEKQGVIMFLLISNSGQEMATLQVFKIFYI